MNKAASIACRHFPRCGGCSCLDVPIAEQLRRKVSAVRLALGPHLGDLPIEYAVPDGEPRHDRLKLLFPAQPDARGELQLGLYERGSHAIVGIEECQVQAEALTMLATRVQAILRRRSLPPYDERRHRGVIRALHARIAAGTGELLLGLVSRQAAVPDRAGLTAELLAAAIDLPVATTAPVRAVGVVLNVHPERGNYLLGPTTHVLAGRDHLFDRADGLEFRVSFASFLQVHRQATTLLYHPALAMLGEVSGQSVVDAFGGVGTFGLRVARAGARRVTIVEANPSACADARANIVGNAFESVDVVEAPFARAIALDTSPDALIVDPPRAGLGEAGCQRAVALRAARILYVSCNPASLARDLPHLAGGYAITAVRVVDLFPHTDHCEVLVRLERRRT